jgi:UDP-N-acetylmuramate dehydrogenase
MTDITPQLTALFGERLKENEPMSKHTNFRIGGPARWFVDAKTEDEIRQAVELATNSGVPYFVLGGGSNTLCNDAGYEGLVIQIGMRAHRIEGNKAYAEAGVISAALARAAAEAGLAGFEWAISLPGTIGGAVRGNAGCYGGEIKDTLVSARVLHDGKIVEISNANLKFGYRESAIKHSNDIVLSATFELKPGDRDALLAKEKDLLERRKKSQPLYAGSAGCVFKNFEAADDAQLQRIAAKIDVTLPPEMIASRRLGAGWVIDQLDLKGKRIGGAMISPEHGNFIINTGNATASDIVQLIAMAKMYARDRFGIQLEEEVQYLGS